MRKFSVYLSAVLIASAALVTPFGSQAATFSPGYCSPDYLYHHLQTEVDTRIEGVTASDETKSLWVTRGDGSGGWQRNPNVWTSNGTSSIDWTGLSPWNSNGGYYFAGTLVSPRHIVYANHYQMGIGSSVAFVDRNNNVVTRTLQASQTVLGTDITVGLLDSDVPESITYYPVIASTTWEAYMFSGDNEVYNNVPMVLFDQDDHATLDATSKYALYLNSALAHYGGTSGHRGDFLEELIGGDSGNPGFVLVGGKPVLVLTHYSAIAGPSYSYHRQAINDVMSSLGGGYQLSDVDLSCFDAPISLQEYNGLMVDEGAPEGTAVGFPTIKHNVENATPRYTVISGNSDGAFAVSSTTGQVTVASSTLINASSTFPRTLLLNIQKEENLTSSSTMGLGVSLRAYPRFEASSFEFSVDENSATSTHVGRTLAIDPNNDTLTYSIVSGNSSGAFAISSSGRITVANPAAIDYESDDTFDLVVRATEAFTGERLYVEVPVRVTVRDVSIVLTALSYGFSVDESASTGASVGSVIASSTDSNIPSVRYSIVSGNSDGAFTLSSTTGQVSVANPASFVATATSTRNLFIAAASASTPSSTLATALATVSFTSNARPSVSFEAPSSILSEGLTRNIPVNLVAPYSRDVLIPYSVHDGSAVSSDYAASAGVLLIEAGDTSASIMIEALTDSAYESDEAFTITLGAPTRASLGSPSTHTVTIRNTTPAPSSSSSSPRRGGGGGGGGGGSSSASASFPAQAQAAVATPQIADLIRMFVQMNPQLAALLGISTSFTTVTSVTGGAPALAANPGSLSSCPDLEAGATGSCVRMLQEFLNAKGYAVSTSGAGSIGQETTYFGPATTRALARFQSASGITPASGYLGPKTKAAVKAAGY